MNPWVWLVLGVVAVAAGYFLPRDPGRLKTRSMQRCAQDADLANVKHGGLQ